MIDKIHYLLLRLSLFARLDKGQGAIEYIAAILILGALIIVGFKALGGDLSTAACKTLFNEFSSPGSNLQCL